MKYASICIANVKGYIRRKIITQKGVSRKNPKPNALPAAQVEVATTKAQKLDTTNQLVQYAIWLAPKIFNPACNN